MISCVFRIDKESEDLDDALCNKLIIVTQTPPFKKGQQEGRKIDLNKEMEHTLRRYEQELWSSKHVETERVFNLKLFFSIEFKFKTNRNKEQQEKNKFPERNKQFSSEGSSSAQLSANVWTKKAMERAAAIASIVCPFGFVVLIFFVCLSQKVLWPNEKKARSRSSVFIH